MGTHLASAGTNWVMSRQDDRELWSAIADGDADAFGVLFERYGSSVYSYCFRRTGDWTRAQDLTSIVFLECWRRRNVTIERESVLPWLLGIATNVCRHQRRSFGRHHAALRRLPPPERALEFAEEAIERLEAERRMRTILSLVSQLPKREQDVLALCVWAGLTYEEAATALRIPVGTVRSRLARARAHLRTQVERNAAAAVVPAHEELRSDAR
jgi:RNA polymerase sigma factor (sigma-70 family)